MIFSIFGYDIRDHALKVWKRVDPSRAAAFDIIFWHSHLGFDKHPYSQVLLSMMHNNLSTNNQIEGLNKVFIWMKRAADKNDDRAVFSLGEMYFKGEWVKKDTIKGLDLMDKAEKSGDSDVTAYLKGQQILVRLEKEAKDSNSNVLFILAKLYAMGEGVEQNKEKSIAYAMQAAELGHKEAQKLLDKLDRREESSWIGRISYPNCELLKFFAEYGVLEAQLEMAEYCGGVASNRSLSWYIRAAKQGHVESQYIAGRKIFQQDERIDYYEEELAKDFLLKAARSGHVDACYEVSRVFGMNEHEAFSFLEKAAVLGHEKAQFDLARKYQRMKNHFKANEWYLKLAEQNLENALCKKAQFELGEAYFYGNGVEKNHLEAFKWYDKGTKGENGVGHVRLGDCYFLGVGVQKSENQAFQIYYEKQAHFRLSWCYGNGIGVEVDIEKAFLHCIKAYQRDPFRWCIGKDGKIWGYNTEETLDDSTITTMCIFNAVLGKFHSLTGVNWAQYRNSSLEHETDSKPPHFDEKRYLELIFRSDFSSRPIALAMQQTLFKKYPEYFDCIEVVMGDFQKSIPKKRLAFLSVKLEALVSSPFLEVAKNKIVLSEDHYNDEAKVFLDYLETGVLDVHHGNVIALFDLAQHHIIPALSRKLVSFLTKNLDATTFPMVIEHAIESRNRYLFGACCVSYSADKNIARNVKEDSSAIFWVKILKKCTASLVSFVEMGGDWVLKLPNKQLHLEVLGDLQTIHKQFEIENVEVSIGFSHGDSLNFIKTIETLSICDWRFSHLMLPDHWLQSAKFIYCNNSPSLKELKLPSAKWVEIIDIPTALAHISFKVGKGCDIPRGGVFIEYI